MKLQILIPQYQEDAEIIQPLLDSIQIQQSVDVKNDVGVIIVNDGSDIHLPQSLFDRYTYKIDYYLNEHKGVSATRNACLDKATADYVMFCDADDMFLNACGLYIVFREMVGEGFDSLISSFVEETKNHETGESLYITHGVDSTFVHGKVYRRQFLLDRNIRWNDSLTIHEDSYFNGLAQRCSKEVKYSQTPFYLWRWRDNSVCRHDPKYILKTYNNMLDSSTSLIEQFKMRGMHHDAMVYATTMIYDAYFTMNKKEWLNQENQNYRQSTERRFKSFWKNFNVLFENIDANEKNQIVFSVKNRMFQEGLVMESITFNDWIKQIESL